MRQGADNSASDFLLPNKGDKILEVEPIIKHETENKDR